MTPVDPTACRFLGAGGGKVSRGVTQIGSDGSLSICARPTVATLRTTKHCSFPGAAPSCTNVVASSGWALRGAGAATRPLSAVAEAGLSAVAFATADGDPAAGTA